MPKKIWVLCNVDNFGQIDMNSVCGGYTTKKEAETKLKELTKKYGLQGFEVKQIRI